MPFNHVRVPACDQFQELPQHLRFFPNQHLGQTPVIREADHKYPRFGQVRVQRGCFNIDLHPPQVFKRHTLKECVPRRY